MGDGGGEQARIRPRVPVQNHRSGGKRTYGQGKRYSRFFEERVYSVPGKNQNPREGNSITKEVVKNIEINRSVQTTLMRYNGNAKS
jgi:hypothetical protein